jgi:hypothetical protein
VAVVGLGRFSAKIEDVIVENSVVGEIKGSDGAVVGVAMTAVRIYRIFTSVLNPAGGLRLPIRAYLANVLPRLANRSIHSLAELTPGAYAVNTHHSRSTGQLLPQPCTCPEGYL